MDTIPQGTPQKQCSTCERWKPATLEYFYANKRGKYGLYARCIVCFRAKRHKGKTDTLDGFKQCTVCNKILPETKDYFYTQNKKGENSLRPACKKCSDERDERRGVNKLPPASKRCKDCKKVYPATDKYFPGIENRDMRFVYRCMDCSDARQKNLMREEVEFTPDGFKKCPDCKATKPATDDFFYRRAKGREQGKLITPCRECCAAKHITEEHRKRVRRHYTTHKGWYRARDRNREAQEKQIAGKHTAKQIKEQYHRQAGQCYYCKNPIPWGEHHVDHTFPLSRVVGMDIPANDISYLVIACRSCNLKKGDKFPWEWPEGGRLL